jgi:hypothetical protein
VPDGVDTGIQEMQASPIDSTPNRTRADPEIEELPSRNHPMLSPRDLRQASAHSASPYSIPHSGINDGLAVGSPP